MKQPDRHGIERGPERRIDHFQQLYRQDDDPWQVRQSWYEQRKRALILAALPQQRYRSAYEPGCGNGELTVALAKRCDWLLAADGSAAALRLARERLQRERLDHNVLLEQHVLPRDWPYREFDLILISELAYYLERDELVMLVEQSAAALAPGGTLLLCHWRAPFDDRAQPTEKVHAAFHTATDLHRLLRHDEDDFLLEVWSNDTASVLQRERVS